MYFVFLSYARDDLKLSTGIRQRLMQNNVQVWRDLEDIRKDKAWEVEIEKILDSGRLTHFLFLETNRACREDSVCRDEIERAVGNKVPIIRLQFEKPFSIPLRLQRKTYIDFRSNYDGKFQELLDELPKSAVVSAAQTPLPPLENEKMPTQQQIAAAQDKASLLRVVAPPGSGKSFVIEERVRWLLETGIEPEGIYVVSFTRASSGDLRDRIIRYARANGRPEVGVVQVRTLHSLALRVLLKNRLLNDYPVSPKVLDNWETENIFDVEMGNDIKRTSNRCADIRQAVEAYWATGQWTVPPDMQPDDPISQEEIDAFNANLDPLTQIYACVLPGQIVKKCTDFMKKGLLHPATTLKATHLIVDEFQDLNFTDTEFVRSFTTRNVSLFVAGDDDQSVYAFRFAYPTGIQQFLQQYAGAVGHELTECFRCTSEVLRVASDLLSNHQDPNRIKKKIVSHYEQTLSQIRGLSERWIFKSENKEAEAIARSCKGLIDRGIAPQDILILLSNRKDQLSPPKKGSLPPLEQAFRDCNVPVEFSRLKPYTDTNGGRFVYTLLRIACDANLVDYVAHRTLLGLLKGVGEGICNNIRHAVLARNYNYLDIFYNPYPDTMFGGRERRAIEQLKALLNEATQWNSTNTLGQQKQRIADLLTSNFEVEEADKWLEEVRELPAEMTLEEACHYLEAHQDDQRITVLTKAYERLKLPIPDAGLFPPKVRVMTMHGIKGLEAQVVFIPGLELGILPKEKARRYPGLRLEAARLLYVSITRAKAAVIMSYAKSRVIHGTRDYGRAPSPFVASLGGKFNDNDGTGLRADQVDEVVKLIAALKAES